MAKPKNTPGHLDARKVPEGEREVLISTITQDPDFQARGKLNAGAIRQIATRIRLQQVVEPVKIIRVDGVAFLADGWHRTRAHTDAGREAIRAVIQNGTTNDLRTAAATANVQHGTPLTTPDKLRAFQLYVKGRGHRKPGGECKSSREIAADLGGIYSHVTVLEKMRQHHPKIYARMTRGAGGEKIPDRSDPLLNTSRQRARAVQQALENAREEMRGVGPSDLESRWQIREQLNQLLKQVQNVGGVDLDRLRAKTPIDEFDAPFESAADTPTR